MKFDNINIRLLMYADDIVIISDNKYILQDMIINLERYCTQWNVEVNLAKSEIMVFRKGGILARDERWTFNGNEVKIATEFCYLGVIFTPKLSFQKHIEKRNEAAKNSINSTWNNFLRRPNISLKSKWKLFLAVCRSIQAYAAQIWGHRYFSQVDKLHIYFIKKILRLPNCTPTYMIMMETGIENGHLFTLDIHLRYINKTLFEYSNERLPHIFTKMLINYQIFWVADLNTIGSEYQIEWTSSNINQDQWNANRHNLLQALRVKNYGDYEMQKQATNRIYKHLNPMAGQDYMSEGITAEEISWIMKMRSETTTLNNSRFAVNASKLCSLCNTRELEDVVHFLGRCPVFKELRNLYFKDRILEVENVINMLDGKIIGWKLLAKYIKHCIEYRNQLIHEFNY